MMEYDVLIEIIANDYTNRFKLCLVETHSHKIHDLSDKHVNLVQSIHDNKLTSKIHLFKDI